MKKWKELTDEEQMQRNLDRWLTEWFYEEFGDDEEEYKAYQKQEY